MTDTKNYAAAEVLAALEVEDGDFDWYGFEDTGNTVELRGETVPIEPVASFGGEGEGEKRWVVAKIGDQLFRKDGFYASHYGTAWDGEFYEVTAQERTITVYETPGK